MNVEYTIADKLDLLLPLIQAGFVVAVIIMILFSAARIGWKLAPLIFTLAAFAYLFL